MRRGRCRACRAASPAANLKHPGPTGIPVQDCTSATFPEFSTCSLLKTLKSVGAQQASSSSMGVRITGRQQQPSHLPRFGSHAGVSGGHGQSDAGAQLHVQQHQGTEAILHCEWSITGSTGCNWGCLATLGPSHPSQRLVGAGRCCSTTVNHCAFLPTCRRTTMAQHALKTKLAALAHSAHAARKGRCASTMRVRTKSQARSR